MGSIIYMHLATYFIHNCLHRAARERDVCTRCWAIFCLCATRTQNASPNAGEGRRAIGCFGYLARQKETSPVRETMPDENVNRTCTRENSSGRNWDVREAWKRPVILNRTLGTFPGGFISVNIPIGERGGGISCFPTIPAHLRPLLTTYHEYN